VSRKQIKETFFQIETILDSLYELKEVAEIPGHKDIAESIDNLTERIRGIRKLHKSKDIFGLEYCIQCQIPAPCPTALILEGKW